MKTKKILPALLAIGMSLPCAAADWTANVGTLNSMVYDTDCVYFTLVGVSNAKPTLSVGSEWFAMARGSDDASNARLTRAYAMLLAAKLSQSQVRVRTTGATVCGYAQVKDVFMP